jgi:hypothetical protein
MCRRLLKLARWLDACPRGQHDVKMLALTCRAQHIQSQLFHKNHYGCRGDPTLLLIRKESKGIERLHSLEWCWLGWCMPRMGLMSILSIYLQRWKPLISTLHQWSSREQLSRANRWRRRSPLYMQLPLPFLMHATHFGGCIAMDELPLMGISWWSVAFRSGAVQICLAPIGPH